MREVLELLSYPFVMRALTAGALISVCASVLGVILVLKHYALIGHGLSEIGFASLSISAALGLPVMLVSTPAIIIASFVIMFVSQKYKTSGDIAIAVASSFALALGVIAGRGANVSAYLFGSVLAVSQEDVIFAAVLSVIVLASFMVFYNRLFLITYNEDYARSLGINTLFYQFTISVLTALVVVLGMRIMGTLLISGVIILPALTAKNIASCFRSLVIVSGAVSFIAFTAGLALSFVFNLPAGAVIVMTNTAILIIVKVSVKK